MSDHKAVMDSRACGKTALQYQGSKKQLKELNDLCELQQKNMEEIGMAKSKYKRESFTGLSMHRLGVSPRTELITIGKNGKSLSTFNFPKLNRVAASIAEATDSIIMKRHAMMCKAMFLDIMPSIVTKGEARAMEYFRKPLKRLTKEELQPFCGGN